MGNNNPKQLSSSEGKVPTSFREILDAIFKKALEMQDIIRNIKSGGMGEHVARPYLADVLLTLEEELSILNVCTFTFHIQNLHILYGYVHCLHVHTHTHTHTHTQLMKVVYCFKTSIPQSVLDLPVSMSEYFAEESKHGTGLFCLRILFLSK